MEKITLLPKWAIPSNIPSVYDRESGTCIEMTAKVYGAMRKLQEEYNVFVDEFNKTITEFIDGTNQDHEKFKEDITKLIHDYIRMLDDKVKNQDLVIEENITYIKNNIVDGVVRIINEMKETGELEAIIGDSLGGLTTKINEVENELSTISNSVNQISSNITKNENDIDVLEEKVSSIEKKNLVYEYDSTSEALNILYKEVE